MGRVRWVALGTIVVAGVAVGAELRSSPEPLYQPEFGCVMPEAEPPPGPALEVLSNEPGEVFEARATCSCGSAADAGTTVEEQRTLELACRLYSDEDCRHEFKPFTRLTTAQRTAVIVKRSTGDCGGCGALAVAAEFEHGTLKAIGELGRFGRFGNGPDSARWITIAGDPALEVTSSTSKGGYTDEYREVFLRDGDGWKPALCVVSEADDGGAHEKPYHWRAKLTYHSDGAVAIRYQALQRGEYLPRLEPVTIGFDRRSRMFISDTSEDRCIAPPSAN